MARVRPVEVADRKGWDRLYAGYAEFYRVEQTPEMRDRVWFWLHDSSHEVQGFVAEDGGGPVGLAHFRAFARPLSATVGGFLDDLYVAPEAQGSGVAQALIEAVAEEGRRRGSSVVRWITAQHNARARAAYDRMAQETPWVTYDLKL